MKKGERSYMHFLTDIVTAMDKIILFTNQLTTEEFIENDLVKDAVVRNFEVIGEAANQVPNEIKLRAPDVPWEQMYRLRNIVIHHYFGVE